MNDICGGFRQRISEEDFSGGLQQRFQWRISAEDFSRGFQRRISAEDIFEVHPELNWFVPSSIFVRLSCLAFLLSNTPGLLDWYKSIIHFGIFSRGIG